MQHYLIIIEKGEGNHSAFCPDLPGCITTGQTLEETIRNMEEAVLFHIDGLCEDGDPVPPARGLQAHMEAINTDAGDLFTFVGVPALLADAA
ncbi:MAG: type II toxin-antitoxin system HicB family antitoxin [Deltaproteobacteria bacterium]|nr:MAG: type II toxin-antitoxin system HicB family antitoxin [Deltaproteobacteria bacterium]